MRTSPLLIAVVLLACMVANATATSSDVSAILEQVRIANPPSWTDGCSSSQTSVTLPQGTFRVCSNEDQAWLTFEDTTNRQSVLATFEDHEHSSFHTRTIATGNWCHDIGRKSGGDCYGGVVARVATALLPTGYTSPGSAVNVTNEVADDVLIQYLVNTFGPHRIAFPGVAGRCFSNTGEFTSTGLLPPYALVALTQRNFGYSGCFNSEGDNIYWTYWLFFWPGFFGGFFMFMATIAVAIVGGIGGCCCAGKCAR